MPFIESSRSSTQRRRTETEMLYERISRALRDLNADESEFAQDLAQATADDLRPFGYDYYYINWLSVLGQVSATKEVAALSATCVRRKLWLGWSYCRYWIGMANGLQCRFTPVLQGWPAEMIAALLRRGRGIMIISSHYGDYRNIMSDLAILGCDVSVAVDASAAVERERLLRDYPVEMRGQLRYVNVESGGHAALKLARALRNNGVVVVMIDGNSGADGKWGESNRVDVECLGYRTRVKAGAVYLAAAVGAPALSVIAQAGGEAKRIRFGEPLNIDGLCEQAELAGAALGVHYRALERCVRASPEQWEGASLFHRARYYAEAASRSPVVAHHERVPVEVPLRLRMNRMAVMSGDSDSHLVDVQTLRVWRVQSWAKQWLEQLCSPEGLTVARGQNGSGHDHRLSWLAELYVSGVLESRDAL